MTDPAIFHLATPAEWERAQLAGKVAPPSLATEGFVHCSTADQLDGTIARHFADADELTLLRLDPSSLAGSLRWEEGTPGALFPHVYRSISLAEVIEVVPWRRSPGGPGHP